MSNQQLANEFHKPIIRKSKNRRAYSPFKNNIWDAEAKNKVIRYLLCAIDLFSKYKWVAPSKDTKGISIVNAFQKILHNPKRKTNGMWIDQGTKFYNSTLKKRLKDNGMEIYSTSAERCFC